MEPPESPTFFAKFRNALRADGATVTLPAASAKVDYEAEVAFVIGRPAKDVAQADALDYVAGYTLLNDLSARDLQFATPQWMPGKVFDGAAPCGPAIVTPDEAGPHDASGSRSTSTASGCRSRDRRPDLLDPRARRPPLESDDARARRHRLHRYAGRGRRRARPRVWLRPGTSRGQLTQLGRAADDDRLDPLLRRSPRRARTAGTRRRRSRTSASRSAGSRSSRRPPARRSGPGFEAGTQREAERQCHCQHPGHRLQRVEPGRQPPDAERELRVAW